jgi:hydroxyacylglutathione hydrolase
VAPIVHRFPCLQDNYGFLLHDPDSGETACIDTPEADRILAEADARGWRITQIWNTHWHPDHAGGNAAVKAATGCTIVGPKGEAAKIPTLDRQLVEGDTVKLGALTARVLDTPGHTAGHIVYHLPEHRIAFVGDTLFALGCGRLFEGTAEQMWASLGKLRAMPDDTTIYCAHEYTAANARFALSVDDDPAVKARAEAVFAARQRGEPTVPTTIGLEKATNPFLRAPQLAARIGAPREPAYEAFAAVRAAKDGFKG